MNEEVGLKIHRFLDLNLKGNFGIQNCGGAKIIDKRIVNEVLPGYRKFIYLKFDHQTECNSRILIGLATMVYAYIRNYTIHMPHKHGNCTR